MCFPLNALLKNRKTSLITVKAVKNVNSEKIAKMIRFHRKQAGLTQVGLARLAGLGKTVVFDIEKGKESVRLNTLLKVLEVLNIKMEFQGPLMELFNENS